MNDPVDLVKPAFKIIQTLPSSLGTVTYYLVIYDQLDFADKEFIEKNQSDLAENIDEDSFEHPIYVIHSTANRMAEPIQPVTEVKSGAVFSKNITQYDSALTTHCLALKTDGPALLIKTGFHYWSASKAYNGPVSWQTMSRIYDGVYRLLRVRQHQFWEPYKIMLTNFDQVMASI